MKQYLVRFRLWLGKKILPPDTIEGYRTLISSQQESLALLRKKEAKWEAECVQPWHDHALKQMKNAEVRELVERIASLEKD